MTRIRTERKRSEKRVYLNEVAASSSWRKKKTPSQDRIYLIEEIAAQSGLQTVVVKRVIDLLFGNPKLGHRGVIQRIVDSGEILHIDGFGQFGHRMRKAKITNDISNPGTMTYTPASSTFDFKPDKELYWDHFEASMSANMPHEDLPPNMHFSKRITSMPFYRDWQQKIHGLCNGNESKTTETA